MIKTVSDRASCALIEASDTDFGTAIHAVALESVAVSGAFFILTKKLIQSRN